MSRKKTNSSSPDSINTRVRLDKWLWAARFFKTRNLAKQAIDSGKVRCNGSRCKSSREIDIDSILEISQGWDDKTIIVRGLSDKRGSAPQAAQLYEETAESVALRQLHAEQRKSIHSANPHPDGRPSKQDRRLLQRFKEKQSK